MNQKSHFVGELKPNKTLIQFQFQIYNLIVIYENLEQQKKISKTIFATTFLR